LKFRLRLGLKLHSYAARGGATDGDVEVNLLLIKIKHMSALAGVMQDDGALFMVSLHPVRLLAGNVCLYRSPRAQKTTCTHKDIPFPSILPQQATGL
jgi:hypothetical protein